jgi:hypothetical protein
MNSFSFLKLITSEVLIYVGDSLCQYSDYETEMTTLLADSSQAREEFREV